jgi:hypothetical protein
MYGCSAGWAAHLIWDQGVGGSNPSTRTKNFEGCCPFVQLVGRLALDEDMGVRIPHGQPEGNNDGLAKNLVDVPL